VLGRRNDGFHEVATILQTISLHDTLIFERSDNGIELTCDDRSLPIDETNLITKAANALRAEFRIEDGARIELRKLIPMGGGLGGGSSNAAVTLIGLSRLWSLDVSLENLHEIGAGLGSDVPFFLRGGTALATGTGTAIEPISRCSFRSDHRCNAECMDFHASGLCGPRRGKLDIGGHGTYSSQLPF
jgi:4-diphosphocytidyl-2-C-methyl-D-erythritol kinase